MYRLYIAGRCTRHLYWAVSRGRETATMSVNKNSAPLCVDGCPTVGIIIIGDEILKGQVIECNAHFLCKRLFSLGVKVKKISIIADDCDSVASEVADFSRKFTHVITAGGIGPTHDDITFEAIAKAFGEEVRPHPDLVRICQQEFGTDDINSPKFKLAFVPQSSQLHYGIDALTGRRHKYPLIVTRNVYVFPGVPSLMKNAFLMLEGLFRDPNTEFHVAELYVNLGEVAITEILNEANSKFKDRVILGSYPTCDNSYYKVRLSIESQHRCAVEETTQFLQTHLPEGSIIDYEKDPLGNAAPALEALVNASGERTHLKEAVDVIGQALDKYSLDQVCVGFNGGKDCTALLHLVYAVAKQKHPDTGIRLKALYIRRGKSFPEVELFIKTATERYNLDLITITGKIKDALWELRKSHPELQAVFMGTRTTDPYSRELTSFIATDADWPPFMRVNPLLHWTYCDLWHFVRSLSLPYCSLYDRGYTSLGSMENTHPNPSLQEIDERGIITYQPAYKLIDGDRERDGRN